MTLIAKLRYYAYQAYGILVFGKRVYIHGRFKVGNVGNVSIGHGCSINEGVFILGRSRIEIGNNVTLSFRCTLLDAGLDLSSSDRVHTEQRIVIEDGVWIGAGAIVLPGVTVGEGSVVGAGSVVTKNVPPHVVVAGNPARQIRALNDAGAAS